MSKPIVLQEEWAGANQDTPRHQLPKGKVFQCTDFIPELDGVPLAKRGGWDRHWNAITVANYVAGVQIAPFATGSQVVCWDDDGDLHYTASFDTASWTTIANTLVPAHPPTFWKEMVIVADVNGTGSPYRFSGSAIVALGGTPPTGSVSCVYKNHLVLARSAAETRRVWFSNANDYDVWDTATDGQWLDVDMPIRGISALRNLMIVFGEGKTQRIRGDIIPGVVGSDMVVEPLFAIGCSDPASVAVADDYAIFANAGGIYMTDGIGVIDLTEQSGMSNYYRFLMTGYDAAWIISAALYRGWYVFSVLDGASLVQAGMIDVKRRRFVKLTNVKATMMASSPPGILDLDPKLVFSERASLNVANATTCWTPAGAYKNDGDGTAVLPSVETGFYLGRPGLKRWRQLYARYTLTDAASDNPILTASYGRNLNGSYTNLTPTLPEGTLLRKRIPINYPADSITVKLAQTNASAVTEIYWLEADVTPMEPGRL